MATATAVIKAVSRLHPALRALAVLAALCGVTGLALGFLGWMKPVTSTVTPATASGESMTFSYSADVPQSAAYDDTTVYSPEPIFRKLADVVDLQMAYRGEPGKLQVSARLSAQSGWHSTMQLSPPRGFGSERYTHSVQLDLSAFDDRVNAAAKAIGADLGQVAIDITATVEHEDGSTFAPKISLAINPLQMTLSGGAASLVVTQSSTAAGAVVQERQIGAFGHDVLTAAQARKYSVFLLMIAIVGAIGVAMTALRNVPLRTRAQIQRRYPHLLVPVEPMTSPPGKPVVLVDTFPALVKLAEKYGQMILTWTRPDGSDDFIVRDEGITYRYRILSGSEVSTPPDAPATAAPAGRALTAAAEPTPPPRPRAVGAATSPALPPALASEDPATEAILVEAGPATTATPEAKTPETESHEMAPEEEATTAAKPPATQETAPQETTPQETTAQETTAKEPATKGQGPAIEKVGAQVTPANEGATSDKAPEANPATTDAAKAETPKPTKAPTKRTRRPRPKPSAQPAPTPNPEPTATATATAGQAPTPEPTAGPAPKLTTAPDAEAANSTSGTESGAPEPAADDRPAPKATTPDIKAEEPPPEAKNADQPTPTPTPHRKPRPRKAPQKPASPPQDQAADEQQPAKEHQAEKEHQPAKEHQQAGAEQQPAGVKQQPPPDDRPLVERIAAEDLAQLNRRIRSAPARKPETPLDPLTDFLPLSKRPENQEDGVTGR